MKLQKIQNLYEANGIKQRLYEEGIGKKSTSAHVKRSMEQIIDQTKIREQRNLKNKKGEAKLRLTEAYIVFPG